jgi:hypothetical protein
MNIKLSNNTPALVLGYGFIPFGLRGIIHSTSEGDKLIHERAKNGPAKNGRKKYKGDIK